MAVESGQQYDIGEKPADAGTPKQRQKYLKNIKSTLNKKQSQLYLYNVILCFDIGFKYCW